MKKDLKDRWQAYVGEHGLINRGDTLILGLSGGPDSVCLFYLLADMAVAWELRLVAVHVHHGIRGEEADRDASFSAELAHALGAEYEEYRVDAPAYAEEHGLTLEEAARILRYEALEEARQTHGADAIVLAHHRDDQAETVCMNLMRGTGPAGLAGMQPRAGHRIRPLLHFSKKEILEYLKEKNIKYVTDSTNLSTEYTRNVIRNQWLPMAEEIYPEARAHIAAAAEDISVWQSYIRKQAESAMREAGISCSDGADFGKPVRIPVELYLAQDPAIRNECIRLALRQVLRGAKDVTRTHYRQIGELFTDPGSGRTFSLPGGACVRRDYQVVVFEQKADGDAISESESIQIPLLIPGETRICLDGVESLYTTEMVDCDIFKENQHAFFAEKDYTKFIDYDKIRSGLCLRRPREGDYFVLDEQGHRKRLSRFFIDAKVSRGDRNRVILADGSHVVWVLDRLSGEYRLTEHTERILRIRKEEQERHERDDCQED